MSGSAEARTQHLG
ncbi:unnamed protein product, partial [Didymodactylos carnosus]